MMFSDIQDDLHDRLLIHYELQRLLWSSNTDWRLCNIVIDYSDQQHSITVSGGDIRFQQPLCRSTDFHFTNTRWQWVFWGSTGNNLQYWNPHTDRNQQSTVSGAFDITYYCYSKIFHLFCDLYVSFQRDVYIFKCICLSRTYGKKGVRINCFNMTSTLNFLADLSHRPRWRLSSLVCLYICL